MIPNYQAPVANANQPNYMPPRLSTDKPIVARGKAPEELTEPNRTALRIPTPDELGVKIQPTRLKEEVTLDWKQIRQKLDTFGVTKFQLEKVDNGFRFTCQVADRTYEATGSSESDAIQSTLIKLETKRR